MSNRLRLILSFIAALCSEDLSAQSDLPQQTFPESAQLLSQYIQIPSVSGEEEEAAKFLSTIAAQKGLIIQPMNDGNLHNFAASLYPLEEKRPNIIFLNHLDVVPAGDSLLWRFSPHSGAIADGMVWGRGAIDLKGVAVMQLLAIASIQKSTYLHDLPFNVTMLCVAREETDSKGVKFVIEKYLDLLNPVVVFGEGGAGIAGLVETRPKQQVFCVSTAEKQVLWLRMTTQINTSGHASIPPAEYANKVLIKALNETASYRQPIQFNESNIEMFVSLGKMERGARRFVLKNIRLFKPLVASSLRRDPKTLATVSNTISIAQISNPPGGFNQIAQESVALLDCRLLPGTTTSKFVEQLKRRINDEQIKIEIELDPGDGRPSSTSNHFYKSLQQSISEVYPASRVMPFLFPAYTDNSYFRNKGVPVYGIMPVFLSAELLDSVHNGNERIPISALENGVAVYRTLLNRLLLHYTANKE